jgi:hypothetical protein
MLFQLELISIKDSLTADSVVFLNFPAIDAVFTT